MSWSRREEIRGREKTACMYVHTLCVCIKTNSIRTEGHNSLFLSLFYILSVYFLICLKSKKEKRIKSPFSMIYFDARVYNENTGGVVASYHVPFALQYGTVRPVPRTRMQLYFMGPAGNSSDWLLFVFRKFPSEAIGQRRT